MQTYIYNRVYKAKTLSHFNKLESQYLELFKKSELS